MRAGSTCATHCTQGEERERKGKTEQNDLLDRKAGMPQYCSDVEDGRM
jgi:hypothetical protein